MQSVCLVYLYVLSYFHFQNQTSRAGQCTLSHLHEPTYVSPVIQKQKQNKQKTRGRVCAVDRSVGLTMSIMKMIMTSTARRRWRSITDRGRKGRGGGVSCAASGVRPPLILGSGSASRRMLLESAGFAELQVMVPDLDETRIGADHRRRNECATLVTMLAEAKADALCERIESTRVSAPTPTPTLLLTGDSVVTYGGAVREKPSSVAEARHFIESYSNSSCTTVSAACLHDLSSGARGVRVSRATIHFDTIPPEVVDALCKEGMILHCAGGLMAENRLIQPCVRRIDGGLDAVMGLSVDDVCSLIEALVSPS